MGNKPQNNPQKKVTKIGLVDAFTLSKHNYYYSHFVKLFSI